MVFKHFILISMMVAIAAAQRSPYAGRRPIGYPIVETTALTNDALGNRLGETQNATTTNTTTTTNITTTTQRLPIEALGDRDLVNRLGKLPQDKQPFWFLNWQALEQHRQKPQSFNQRPSIFAENTVFFPQDDQNNQNSGMPNSSQIPVQTPQDSQFPQQTGSFSGF